MFDKHKAAKAEAETALLRSTLTAMINVGEGRAAPDIPLRLAPAERAVYRIDGAGLFETRRGPGQWSGRSSGVSVPVGLGVRLRVGQSRGHYVQGAETPTVIDSGTVTFTNQRVVFLGAKYTRTWDFSKLLGVEHDTRARHTAIQVSNRQKTSGFTYGRLRPDLVAAWLELAIALGSGQQAEALTQLKEQLRAVAPPPPEQLAAASAPQPSAPAPPPPSRDDPGRCHPATPRSLPGQGWFPDPSGTHRFRWWDGSQWTAHVSG